jgi:hypothetical protein
MKLFGAETDWHISCAEPQPLVLALYLRDRLGLHPATRPEIPPVVPQVAADQRPAPQSVATMSGEWAGWWEALLAAVAETAPGARPRLLTGLFEPPPQTALAGAGAAILADARQWSQQRKREIVQLLPGAGPHAAVEQDVMRGMRKELSRSGLRTLELRVVVLPVATSWHWRATPTTVLVSRPLRADEATYRRLLTESVRELLAAP